jgi:serine/threonine-protein kinase
VLYIDMRLVEGASVKDELRVNRVLPPARTVSIIAQVAAALDAAHAAGLVHRDIKPENVLLTPDDFAYLVDFGIAYGGGEASVTQTGLVIGSCAYMATERLSGQAGGPASDVYSLTCLLYECLTGRAPFEAGDLREVMIAHMFTAPPRPSVMRRGINPAFDDVVAKGMAKNPADRYPSAGALAKAAAAAVNGQPAAGPVAPQNTRQFPAVPPPYAPHPPATPVKKARFSKPQVALLAGTVAMFALAAVLAGAIVMTGGSGGSEPQSPLAAPPPATMTVTTTAPATSEETTPSTTSSTAPTTSPSTSPSTGASIAGMSDTDGQGFVGHSARCDAGSTPAAAIRTANSLAIVCETAPGSYYYRGERLRDGAQLQLANAVPASGGFDAINPADGARYQVRPDQLTISSSRGSETDPALEYGSA